MIVPTALGLVALLGLAAWLDLRRRQIPNQVVAAVALLWLFAWATGGTGPPWSAMGAAGIVLMLGIGAWRCGWLGGGDVKLIAALSLWAGPEHTPSLLFAIALSGGVLALGILLASRLAYSPAVAQLQAQVGRLLPAAAPALAVLSPRGAVSLPYAVAVAVGGCWLVRRLFLA
jgi:prepilin peptidase CpaA